MLNPLRLLLVPAALAFCTACDKSHAEIVAPFLPQLDELRATLQSLVNRMPPEGSVVTSAPNQLTPQLVLETNESGGNAYGLMFEELSDMENDGIRLDLGLDRAVSTALHWSGESRRNDTYSGGDPEFMKEILESATTARYIVVHRVTNLRDAVAVDRKHFEGGSAEIEGVVFDLADLSIAASYTLSVQTPEGVSYLTKGGDDRLDDIERFAHSALWEEARQEAAGRLRELTGADVSLE